MARKDVWDVVDVLDDVTELDRLLARRDELQKIVAELQSIEEQINARAKAVVEALRQMDVADDGNFGWENRVTRFLLAFARRAREIKAAESSDSR